MTSGSAFSAANGARSAAVQRRSSNRSVDKLAHDGQSHTGVADLYTWVSGQIRAAPAVNAHMIKRILLSVARRSRRLGAAPAAADTVIVPGAEAQRMTALDRTVVWTTGKFPSQTLMQRSPDGTVGPVKGAPVAVYRSIDLGRDAQGPASSSRTSAARARATARRSPTTSPARA